MNFKLFIFAIVLVGVQSSKATEFEAKFIDVQENFYSINNFLDNDDSDGDVALKDLKELNFNASKTVKLAGREYKQSNCEGSENLCKLYKANLVKCVNENYQKSSQPAFKCSIVDADNVDEDLEITNAMIGCNNPQNKLPGYIRTPCVFRYQFRFKEDGSDIYPNDLVVLNFDSSRTVKLGEKELKQAECEKSEANDSKCERVDVQLIKCKIQYQRPTCEIKSAKGSTHLIAIDNPRIHCNYSPNKKHQVRPPCFLKYQLKIFFS